MALELVYSYLFVENLEKILLFYDERNGNSNYSQKLLKRIQEALQLLTLHLLTLTRECSENNNPPDSIGKNPRNPWSNSFNKQIKIETNKK